MTSAEQHYIDPDDLNNNTSGNPAFETLIEQGLSRRSLLRGSIGTAAAAVFGTLGASLANLDTPALAASPARLLGFREVGKSLADRVIVPEGYSASVLYALGDPLDASTPDYKNDGTDSAYDQRAGDHHDGMEWFGLDERGRPSVQSGARGLLAMNHEATTDEKLSSFFLHADGGTSTLPRPASEVDKEIDIHGVSVVEVRRKGKAWEYLKSSAFNRRLTPLTEMEISGPAKGSPLLVTRYSPNATRVRGTINNCGTGKTPWGTLLTGEENWAGYFTRPKGDDVAREGAKSVTALVRYGRSEGASSRHGWESGGTGERYARWNAAKTGSSSDGSDDYRNELNTMGYIVELDAYDKTRSAKKRSALGRFAHESAAFGKVVPGQPLAVYQGDDSRNEYIYKWVSKAVWSAADANPADRLATGDKYLDEGRLYVAKFNGDGTGQWLELAMSNPAIASYARYPFDGLADISVNTRLAADAAGATKMDRPEWCSVNPANGEIYYTLTNNSNRRVEPTGSAQSAPDSANPRAYSDVRGAATVQTGNVNGHILRMKEDAAGSAATTFTWDVYLFGAEASASPAAANLSGLSGAQDFSSPDGLAFSKSTGICWIQTDDGAFTDVTNCMMLAGLPGQVGDGGKVTLSYPRASGGPLEVTTFVGKPPSADRLKRFLVGPSGCEITGVAETPDGRTLFINIQHPGENTAQAHIGDVSKYTSQWPANAGYGSGKRPRSATIVITRNDGGVVGS
ncbi:MAG: PhoX family phosphatase [Pseudomonadota bacterium]